MNHIFYLMGKSASGKDAVYKKLLERYDFNPLVLYTTRPMRENEADGREYYFSNEKQLEEMEASGNVIEKRIYNTVHGKWIYFTSSENINLEKGNYLGIGTIESYSMMKKYFGEKIVIPVYIEVEDGIRLSRAIERERSETNPKYVELCRRFISDSEDFSKEKIHNAGITRIFYNNSDIDSCIDEITEFIDRNI